MITGEKVDILARKFSGKRFINSKGENQCASFNGLKGQKFDNNRGYGREGIRGLGMCGHPTSPWPLSIVLEETDEYIIACCDAGCATILLKDPPIKKKKGQRGRRKLVKTLDGNLEIERKKGLEDNIFE